VGVTAKGEGCESRLLIDPSDVDRSYVLEKIESSSPECGQAMPLTGRLTDAEKACIRAWATALAGGPSKRDSGGGTPEASAPVVDSGGTQ